MKLLWDKDGCHNAADPIAAFEESSRVRERLPPTRDDDVLHREAEKAESEFRSVYSRPDRYTRVGNTRKFRQNYALIDWTNQSKK